MRELATKPTLPAKALLASLMATEKLTVEQDARATTAMFNVESRVLTLPVWKDLGVDTLDMLIGHEVSHALHTPAGRDSLEAACKVVDPNPNRYSLAKDYINVVEDARIERLIKRDYPGLRRCFLAGYDDLMKRDLFGLAKIPSIADLPLIDRINLQYKIGHRVNIPFTAAELPLVQRVAVTSSWNEVVALSKEIYDLAKQQKKDEQEQKKQQQASATAPDTGDESEESEDQSDADGQNDGSQDDQTDNKDTGDENGSSAGGADEDESGLDDAAAPEGEEGEGDVTPKGSGDDAAGGEQSGKAATGSDTDPNGTKGDDEDIAPDASQTAKNAADNLAAQVDTTSAGAYYADLPKPTDKFIVSLADVLAGFRNHYREVDAQRVARGYRAVSDLAAKACYAGWKTGNADAVQVLATEFDRRKAADEHKRTAVAETGVIDINRLHAYRITDDIFLRNAVVKDGKNHGLVLLLDMSGSIQPVFFDLMTQLVTLAHFCRRVNIPFRFYGFTDRSSFHGPDKNTATYASTTGYFTETSFHGEKIRTRLLTLLSDGMKTLEFNEQCGYLLWTAYVTTRGSGYRGSDRCPTLQALNAANITKHDGNIPAWFHLDQTPLNAALLAALDIVPKFQREKRLQVANLIVLTDGEASDDLTHGQIQSKAMDEKRAGKSGWPRLVWRDPVTRREYDFSKKSLDGRVYNRACSSQQTEVILQVLADRGIRTTCIHVAQTAKKAHGIAESLPGRAGVGAAKWQETVDALKKSIRDNDWCHLQGAAGYYDYIVFPVATIEAEEELTAITNPNDKAGLRTLRSQFKKVMNARRANRPLMVRVAEIVSK